MTLSSSGLQFSSRSTGSDARTWERYPSANRAARTCLSHRHINAGDALTQYPCFQWVCWSVRYINMASLMTQDKAPRLRHFYESILVFYFVLFNYKLSDYKYSYSKMHSVHYAQLLCLQIVTFLSSAAVFFVDQRRLHCPVTFPHICGWHGSLPLCLWFRSHEGSAPDLCAGTEYVFLVESTALYWRSHGIRRLVLSCVF